MHRSSIPEAHDVRKTTHLLGTGSRPKSVPALTTNHLYPTPIIWPYANVNHNSKVQNQSWNKEAPSPHLTQTHRTKCPHLTPPSPYRRNTESTQLADRPPTTGNAAQQLRGQANPAPQVVEDTRPHPHERPPKNGTNLPKHRGPQLRWQQPASGPNAGQSVGIDLHSIATRPINNYPTKNSGWTKGHARKHDLPPHPDSPMHTRKP
ncbi:hypothetical protein BJ138DRAFT_1097978 [Hygrophoropsis aurantiaca]|uniref:Uncharacterized protein n=1 Tax=Hygrophoropsis aurantiaca TaxID=72124 RepID=A0ACB8AQ55_9AGAM|nr:hypothetical protein BJ138DRAFT_1097978 [Hygrophoropsis aurantiaca]